MRVLVAIAMTLALFEPNVANAFTEGEKVAWPSMPPRPPLAPVHAVTHAPTEQQPEELPAFSRVQDVMMNIFREHNREVRDGDDRRRHHDRQHQQHEQHLPTHETTTSKPMMPKKKKMHRHKPVVHEVSAEAPPAAPTRHEVSLHTAHGDADAAADAANAQSGPFANVVESFRQAMARARAFRARLQQQEEEQEQQHATNPTTPPELHYSVHKGGAMPPELHYSVHKGGAMPPPPPELPPMFEPLPPPMFEPLPLPRDGHLSKKHPTPRWVPMCEAELTGPLCADADARFPVSRHEMRKVFGDPSHHMTSMPSTLHMLRLRLIAPRASPAQRQLHQHEEESPHGVCPRRHRLAQLHCLLSHKTELSPRCTIAVEVALQRFHLRHPDWHHPDVVEGGRVDGGRLGQRTDTGDEGAKRHHGEHNDKHHHGRHHHWRHSKTARWIHHHRGFLFATMFVIVMWFCLWRRSVAQRARAAQAAKDRRAAAARRSAARSGSSNNESAIDVRARHDRAIAAGSVSPAAARAAAGAQPKTKTKSKSKQKTKPSAPRAPVRQERVMPQPPATPYHRVYDEPGRARGDDGVQYPSLTPFDVPAYTPVYI